jgi:hypothetical protein
VLRALGTLVNYYGLTHDVPFGAGAFIGSASEGGVVQCTALYGAVCGAYRYGRVGAAQAQFSASPSVLDNAGALSIVGLTYIEAFSGTEMVVATGFRSTDFRAQYMLRVNPANGLASYYHYDNATARVFEAGRVPVGRPFVLGVSRASDGRTVTLYVDGEPTGSTTLASAPVLTPNSFRMGGYSSLIGLTTTRVDDVAIYSSALSDRAHKTAARVLLRRTR